MLILLAISLAALDNWQPTINTVLLIALALLGERKLKVHRRGKRVMERRLSKRVDRIERTVEETSRNVHSIQELLDSSGDETRHLH